ncbi:MAG: FAD-dependent oxidoreductase [Polyangiaceae bacterium]
MPRSYVILGGGPCGLAAAWELARAGHRPIVLEREQLVGGLCATHTLEGDDGTWRFDLGGHRFVSSDEHLSQWLEALLGSDLLTQERKSVVLHDGRRFKYPLDARDLIHNLGLGENLRALAGYAVERTRQSVSPRADRSFEDWVVARFGRPLYDTFFGPYTHKLWGLHPSRISADWAAERISLLNLGDAALRLVGLRDTPIRTYARRYRYPRLGMGQLYERLAAEVVRLGGEIRRGAHVTDLETEGDRVTAVRFDGARGPERIPVAELLSTIALPELVRALHLHVGEARGERIARATRALRFRSLVFLNLALRRADVSENTWMYVASGGLRISRIQEPKRRSPSMAPTGRTSLMLEIPCDAGDEIWTSDVATLRDRFSRELTELGFATDDVVDAFAVRVEHGYPVYHLGYDDDRRALLTAVERFANVRTAGRQGLFRYVFMDAAMQMGIEAARQMASGERAAGRLDAIGRAKGVLETRAITA